MIDVERMKHKVSPAGIAEAEERRLRSAVELAPCFTVELDDDGTVVGIAIQTFSGACKMAEEGFNVFLTRPGRPTPNLGDKLDPGDLLASPDDLCPGRERKTPPEHVQQARNRS
jgi:hypothetical protein